MTPERISIKTLFQLVTAGAAISMLTISAALSVATNEKWVLYSGGLLTVCALGWMLLLTQVFAKRLSRFTGDLCQIMDEMLNGGAAPAQVEDRETLFARITSRLVRLYGILQENRRRVDAERRELQALVSDISHQVKTPVSSEPARGATFSVFLPYR